MKLFIKNMVSARCILFVEEELKKLNIPCQSVDLGVADINMDLTPQQRTELREVLRKAGLDLLEDRKRILIEKIKNVIIRMIHFSDDLPEINYSCYISEKIGLDYTYLANVFSMICGTTIRHFIIAHKIEKVKELLMERELTLTEISYRLHYSSVAHLSNQFKKVTGLTPSAYRSDLANSRTTLELV